jgi:hypothetical protein
MKDALTADGCLYGAQMDICTSSAARTAGGGSRISTSSTSVRLLRSASAGSTPGWLLTYHVRLSIAESNQWSQVQTQGSLPPRRSGALGVMHENRMFLFGGYDGRDGNYFNDLFFFNFGTFDCPLLASRSADTLTAFGC